MYSVTKLMRKGIKNVQKNKVYVKDENRNTNVNERLVTERWRKYFKS